jgi:hypothetical protein
MKLVAFNLTNEDKTAVWINPRKVSAVFSRGGVARIYTEGADNEWVVDGTAAEAVRKLEAAREE